MLWRSSERSIRDSVRNALAIANSRGFHSIAFPLIGAGSGGGNAERIESIIIAELNQCQFDGEVRVVASCCMSDSKETGDYCTIDVEDRKLDSTERDLQTQANDDARAKASPPAPPL